MATDIPDYSQAVVIQSGSVTVNGNVNATIVGVPAVTINSGSVTATISGTPNVNISGSSINVPVSVQGTATVTVSGTVTVSISGTPNVNIANTPSVTISSGSVSITGTPNINIQSQSITVGVNSPPASVGSMTVNANASNSFTTSAVPAGAYSLGLLIVTNAASPNDYLVSLTIKGHTTGQIYQTINNVNGYVVVPINSSRDTQYDISATSGANNVNILTVDADALVNALGVYVSNNPNHPLNTTTRQGQILMNQSGLGGSTSLFKLRSQGVGVVVETQFSAGNGTLTTSIANINRTGGLAGGTLLSTPGLTSPINDYALRIYPGLPATANISANDAIGDTIQVSVVYNPVSGTGTAAVTVSWL